jgi:RNA polymerase sigma-70 factor (ECF subfamily)
LKNNIKTLILEAQSGNRESFHQLVSFHDERIMTLALQLTRNMQDAEDLYQDVFMKAFKSIGSFRLESEFFTWLYRITVNSFYNFQRKTSQLQKQESLDPEKDATHNISSDSKQSTVKDEVNQAVTRALNQLPIQQKTVFIMKHYEGLKIREISAIMNISDGTVKRYLFRAMERLRPMLQEYRYA